MSEENSIELRSEDFQEVLGSVPPWILRWGITVIAVIVLVLLAGSAVFKYPDVIPSPVTLTGSVPPAAIVAKTSGKLNRLYVVDNQQVKNGDYLAVIENPARTEDVLALKAYVGDFAAGTPNWSVSALPPQGLRLGSLQNLYSQFYTTLFEYSEYRRIRYFPQKIEMTKQRIVQYEAQYQNLLRQQKIGNEQFFLAEKQFRRDSTLNSSGVISNEEYEKAKNACLQNLMAKENMQSSVNNMRIQIEQLKESLLDTEYQDTEKLNGLETQLQSLVTQLKTEIQAWELAYVLKSPVDGTITFTNYWIENQNVSTGEGIFTVIPGNDFHVIGKAMLPVARSGKVKAGQQVNIRLENFPENEYGILRGTVRNISLVPTQTGEAVYYTVEISLPDKLVTTYKKELPRLPNMQGQAGIITEDISLLERLFLPLKKILKESV